jgi:hypothetical protein
MAVSSEAAESLEVLLAVVIKTTRFIQVLRRER